MLEVLQFYVSSFWVWLGITLGMTIICKWIVTLIVCGIGAARGAKVHIGDIKAKE